MNALPALVATVVVASVVAGAGGGAATPSSPRSSFAADSRSVGLSADTATTVLPATDNATVDRRLRVLDLPPEAVGRSSTQAQRVDLGPALQFAANDTGDRLDTLATVERIRSADTATERRTRLRASVVALEAGVSRLEARQSAVIDAYDRGDLSSRSLLRRVAELDAAARELEHRRRRLVRLDTADRFGGRLSQLELELATFTGPVRLQAARVLRGDADPTRFFVASGPDSVVLSTVANETYLREAFRGDRRGTNAGDLTADEAVYDVVAAKYPGIWATHESPTKVLGSGRTYVVRVAHERGTLTAFVDTGTGAVFRETQTRPLDTIETGAATERVRDGLRLRVDRSYAGGPLRIVLNESRTNVPASVNVTLGEAESDSVLVGRTGRDGVLWTVSPGDDFTITAIRGNSVVFVSMTPDAPPRIDDAPNGTDAQNGTDSASRFTPTTGW